MSPVVSMWGRMAVESRRALAIGVALAVIAVFLPTLLALLLGLFAAAVLGFVYPLTARKVGFLVALPVILIAYVLGLLRGFSGLVLLIVLVPAFILPVGLAQISADLRGGKAT